MVLLPGGSYVEWALIDPKGGNVHPTQKPGPKVKVAPFWLDVTPVTAQDYAQCVVDGGCDDEGLRCTGRPGLDPESFPTYANLLKGDHPINCVSQLQAEAYCAHLGKRLPTANEWSLAAHGADRGTPLPWGDGVPEWYDDTTYVCWGRSYPGNALDVTWDCDFLFFGCTPLYTYIRSPEGGTCPVRAHPMGDSPQGIADLVGNVLEWTSTLVPGEKEGRSEAIALLTGSAWRTYDPEGLDVDSRSREYVSKHVDVIGFRCAWAEGSGAE